MKGGEGLGSYLLGDEEEEERVAHKPHGGDQGEDDPGEDVLQPGQSFVTNSGLEVATEIVLDIL